jgi:hypothetical protein
VAAVHQRLGSSRSATTEGRREGCEPSSTFLHPETSVTVWSRWPTPSR